MKSCKLICLLLSVIFVLTAMPGCHNQEVNEETQPPTAATEEDVRYQVREGIQTVLICCTETDGSAENTGGFRNENKANFLMLMIIDELSEKITLVQINPDSQISFRIPGKTEKADMPIGSVCSYGSGGSDSSLHLLGEVADLLSMTGIDHYLTFTMDAVSMVNDAIGGVSVLDSAYFGELPEEESVLLSGGEAVKYFSFRDAADFANEERMARQHRYMRALYGPFLTKAQDDDFLSDLLLQLGDSMATDLTLSQLILMFETFEKYELDKEVTVIPGKLESAGETAYFAVDADAVKKAMEQLIYE